MKRTKERDRESEKPQMPDKLEVICPLIFKLTGLAVNYDLTWQPETKITVENQDGSTESEVTGVWKSNPVVRGHTDIFQREMQKMRESEDISWNESAYYFTHEEGMEARKAYEKEVLEGRIKAHITSWGPNPKKANDKSRFHKFTGVGFEELKEQFPEVYSSRPGSSAKPETEEKEEKEPVHVIQEKVEIKAVVEEPSETDLTEIQEEEKVAAATAVEDTIEELVKEQASDQDDQDEHDTLVLFVPEGIASERIDTQNESLGWLSSDGEQMQAYLMEVPECGISEMWLPEGKITINGVNIEVRVER